MNLRVKLADLRGKSKKELFKMLKERDDLSKNWIIKKYRKYHNLKRAYREYYQTTLWKQCVKPILKAYIMFDILEELINNPDMRYKCPRCSKIKRFLVPHHKSYPRLAKKWNYKGFDNRIMLNNPDKIELICNECHEEVHFID